LHGSFEIDGRKKMIVQTGQVESALEDLRERKIVLAFDEILRASMKEPVLLPPRNQLPEPFIS
jgi:hypothetical protein